MSDTQTQTLRCRLCAVVKPCSQLVNLQKDEYMRQKTLEKLSRFSIIANLDSIEDEMEKTVCNLCMSLLDNAFDFVMKVEAAQSTLNIHRNIKKESDNITSIKPAVTVGYITNPITYCSDNESETDLSSNSKTNDSVEDPCNLNDNRNQFVLGSNISKLVKQDKKSKTLHRTSVEASAKFQTKDSIIMKNMDRDSQSETLSHLSTWSEVRWMCAYCDTIFSTLDQMRNHSMQFHGCCNVYRCIDCKARKFHLDRFLRHIRMHWKDLSLSCYKCHKSFSTVKSLQNHMYTHMTSENKCKGCSETFKNLDELTKHRDLYMKAYKHAFPPSVQQLADNRTCKKCQKTFSTKGSLKQHLKTHLTRRRDYICDKCGKCFITEGHISEHMIIHEDFKRHQCITCKKFFRTLAHLREHMSIHDNQKPFACDQCGKRFRLQRYLNSHATVHTTSRPWVCTVCRKSFRFRCKLNDHKRQHTGEKPYSCKICQRAFTNWPNYYKHLKVRHRQETTQIVIK